MKKMFKNEKGFTLIELMIVIAILGILAAVAIPNFLNARGKAQDASALSTLEALKTALEMHAADNGAYSTAAVSSVADLKTLLGEDWPSNIDTSGTGPGCVKAPTINGNYYTIFAYGRDTAHCYSLTNDGTKGGPSATGQ